MVKFERLLKDSPKSNGAIQASIFLISEAIKNNDTSKINSILDQIEINTDDMKDPILLSYFHKIKCDIALNDNNYKEAISNYKDAINFCSNKVDMAKYQISISNVLLLQKKYGEAKKILEDVALIKKLSFNEKNKTEEMLAYIKQKINT